MEEIQVYVPNQRGRTGFFKSIWLMFKDSYKSRQLIWVLFKRDFLATYRKSFLGLAWLFIGPVVGIVSWVVLQYAGILTPGDVGIPYSFYVLISSSIWGLFMGFYGSASGTLTSGAEFIMQVKYPHEALLFKQALQQLVSFFLNFILNIIIILVFGVVPSAYIIIFPLLIIPLFFLASAMGLIMSVVNVVASDISNIFNILLGFVFYITPVVYTIDKIHSKSQLLSVLVDINPLTYLIGGIRDLIIYGQMNYPDRFIVASIFSLILFLLALRLFYISEAKVIEKML